MTLHTTVAAVTARITERSRPTRQAYLHQVDAAAGRDPGAQRLGCANVAHAFAAMPEGDWTTWANQRFHPANLERAALLAADDPSPPPTILRLMGID